MAIPIHTIRRSVAEEPVSAASNAETLFTQAKAAGYQSHRLRLVRAHCGYTCIVVFFVKKDKKGIDHLWGNKHVQMRLPTHHDWRRTRSIVGRSASVASSAPYHGDSTIVTRLYRASKAEVMTRFSDMRASHRSQMNQLRRPSR